MVSEEEEGKTKQTSTGANHPDTHPPPGRPRTAPACRGAHARATNDEVVVVFWWWLLLPSSSSPTAREKTGGANAGRNTQSTTPETARDVPSVEVERFFVVYTCSVVVQHDAMQCDAIGVSVETCGLPVFSSTSGRLVLYRSIVSSQSNLLLSKHTVLDSYRAVVFVRLQRSQNTVCLVNVRKGHNCFVTIIPIRTRDTKQFFFRLHRAFLSLRFHLCRLDHPSNTTRFSTRRAVS